jgi:DTW domain-containing protein YfiP
MADLNPDNDTDKIIKARRSMCKNCERPSSVCLCEFLPVEKVTLATRVFIFQHPAERNSARTTVPIIEKCIDSCSVIDGHFFRGEDSLPQELMEAITRDAKCDLSSARTLLLWPLEDGVSSTQLIEVQLDLSSIDFSKSLPSMHDSLHSRANPAGECKAVQPAPTLTGVRATEGSDAIPYTLVLLHGTWSACRKMLERSPLLQCLPRARIIPIDPVIRRLYATHTQAQIVSHRIPRAFLNCGHRDRNEHRAAS